MLTQEIVKGQPDWATVVNNNFDKTTQSTGQWSSVGCGTLNGWTSTSTAQKIEYLEIQLGESGKSLYLVHGNASMPSGGISMYSSNEVAYIPKNIVPDHGQLIGAATVLKSGNFVVAVGNINMHSGTSGETISFEPSDSVGHGMGFADPVPNGELDIAIAFVGDPQ